MKIACAALLALSLSGVLAACSGSSTSPGLPTPGHSAGAADVRIHIVVPPVQTTSASSRVSSIRRPQYVSGYTSSAQVTITSTATAQQTVYINGCTSSCDISVRAPIGQDTFRVSLYDAQQHLLSQGSATATIVLNAANVVAMTFNGVPASVRVLVAAQPTVHTSSIVHLTVDVLDADGQVIVGPGTYANVNLTDDDTSGATHLSATSVMPPNAGVDVAYNGSSFTSPNASATITGTVAGTSTSGSALISPQPIVTTYPLSNGTTMLKSLTTGPDGALWFTDGFTRFIGRIATTGAIAEYPIVNSISPGAIASGPGSTLWFADTSFNATSIGVITAAGAFSTCALSTAAPTNIGHTSIVEGPDGNMWFGNGQVISRITAGCAETDFTPPHTVGSNMVVGSDGALWFGAAPPGAFPIWNLARMTTAGVFTEYPLPAAQATAGSIVAGADGYLWAYDGFRQVFYRASTSGAVTELPRIIPSNTSPYLANITGPITNGPDGAIWFSTQQGVGRVTPSGNETFYPVAGGAAQITLGPDNALWALGNNAIVRLSL